MNVLVTGGAGYIGSHTVRLLREQGYRVTVLDSMEFGHREAIGDTPLVVGDTGDGELLDWLFAKRHVDAVIHFAAHKAPGESMQDPDRYFRNNVCATQTLLAAMRRAKIERFVFSSTCAVYGTPSHVPVTEKHAPHPESPYGESKLMVEQILRWCDVCYGLRWVSLRYFNAAGASSDAQIGEDPTHTINLIPLVMKVAVGTSPSVRVFGTDYPTPDGTAIRDYIHVMDLADAHIKALELLSKGGRSDIFNLGTGKGASVQEVIDLARRVSGKQIAVEYVGRREGDPVAIWADNSYARQTLGWEPRYSLEEIIESAWRWHSTHPAGYNDSDSDSDSDSDLATLDSLSTEKVGSRR